MTGKTLLALALLTGLVPGRGDRVPDIPPGTCPLPEDSPAGEVAGMALALPESAAPVDAPALLRLPGGEHAAAPGHGARRGTRRGSPSPTPLTGSPWRRTAATCSTSGSRWSVSWSPARASTWDG